MKIKPSTARVIGYFNYRLWHPACITLFEWVRTAYCRKSNLHRVGVAIKYWKILKGKYGSSTD